MPDLGHDILTGVFVPPVAARAGEVRALVRHADRIGVDLCGIQDHPYQHTFLDTWTLLATLAAETERIRLFPDVANLPLRPPAVLARAAASLDALSGGRFELGLGAGALWDPIANMGGPRRTARESIAALEEAIGIIRGLWGDGGRVSAEGAHYRVRAMAPGPPAAHPIGIWIGAYRPRMLGLTGRLADGWIPSSAYLPPDGFGAATRTLDRAARDAGRDPAAIRRLYNVSGDFRGRSGFLQGPPAVWAEQLAEIALEHGVSAFVLAVDPDETATVSRFQEEVTPDLRERVARERTAPRPPAAPRLEVRTDAPAPGEAGAATPEGREGQRLLLAVHEHLRAELAQLREAIADLERGVGDVAAVRSHLRALDLRRACWAVGAFCAAHCRTVALHHAIEDRRLFRDLRDADPSLAPGLDRLVAQHEDVARELARADEALPGLAATPPRIDALREAVEALAAALLPHLDEEEALVLEPIGRLGIAV